jgi:lipopolysaccharide biosynthesis glycosyltransferase
VIHIACAADNKYVQHTAVMLSSLFLNNKENAIHLHFFSANFNIENQKKIETLVLNYGQQFSFYTLDEVLFKDCYISDHISFATYYRIVIPDLLVNQTNKVLYLDTDIVVCKSLKDLWDTEMDNYTIAAVNELNFDGPSRLGFDDRYKYFNAGVLLINTKLWTEAGLKETLFTYIKTHQNKLIFWDQDALNANLYEQRLSIEPKWNQLSPVFEVSNETLLKAYTQTEINDLKQSPYIIHYSGSSKPWDYLNIHPLKKEYFHYLQYTEWKGFRPKTDLKTKFKFVLLRILGNNGYQQVFSFFR